MSAYTTEELMAAGIAREVRDGETVAVGTLAPVPASGVLLAQMSHSPGARVIINKNHDYSPFSNGSQEFYDFAQRGGFDLFFLSGGQIDRQGNLNLIAVGPTEHPKVRLPGGAGSALLYYHARRVIVFRAEHSARIFVERVEHVTSPGSTPPEVPRRGGPWKCVTPLCVFRFDSARRVLVVEALHPGVTREALQQRTGFVLDYDSEARLTPEPTGAELRLLRTRVRDTVARIYPQYAEAAFGS